MGNKDKHFKGQQEKEELICFFRHHWVRLVPEFFYFMLLIFFIVLITANFTTIVEFAQGGLENRMLVFIGYIVLTFGIHRFFIKVLNYFVDIGIVTDTRVIDHHKTVFFKDRMEAIDLGQIQELEQSSDGFFPNIFKYGDIKIYIMGVGGAKVITRIKNVKFHFRCIARQKTLYSRRMEEILQENKPKGELSLSGNPDEVEDEKSDEQTHQPQPKARISEK